ncbi:hypothetical protein [Candidatus Nitrosocosmicus arcticus]|uniref:Uncharacterized protein n=1 Tax=Candidatus Nitrosocosmicus arcticus TaxID=2035267 RepID=A0A557STX2_9ARCH|nr:hypothetical protein [Candidatus Nitrosocosmicus arcticus]TVP40053.1 membrane protein of unknown function [Candidatus Nitrosocosmicus arcticus]
MSVTSFTNKLNLAYITSTILLAILVGTMTVDILLGDLSLVLGNFSWAIPLFILMVIIYAFIQYFTIQTIRKNNEDVEKRNSTVRRVSLGMYFFQYIIISLLLYLTGSMLVRNSYDTSLVMVLIGMSYAATSIIFAMLSLQFIKWYLANRNFLVLLYFVVTIVISFRIIAIIPFYEDLLASVPVERSAESLVPEYNPEIFLNNIYGISSGVANILLWISTSLLLKHYKKKIGNIRYYLVMVVIGLSAAYSMSDFVLTPAVESYFGEVEYWTFTAFQGVLSGIALGIPFWSISIALKNSSKKISYYMLVCGFAFCIFITAGSAIIDHSPYPPFGLVAIMCMQLSSFMLFTALYSSAISISEDIGLRNIIRKNFKEQADLLERIGFAEMEEELLKRTVQISMNEANQMYNTTGIQSTVNELELKKYAEEVLQEIKDTSKT